MHINHKNIYHDSEMFLRDLVVKDNIEDNFKTNPAYGHRRLAMDLKMNKKKILRVMHEFHLKPPRLWYQKKYITQSDAIYEDQYANLLKDVDEAVLKTKKLPKIFHSDRGREFLSERCIAYLENLHIKISVSDPGSPWQNSWSESFFSRFKTEFGSFNRFETLGELIENIFEYISYYNNLRIQLKLKMSPVQFKLQYTDSVLEKRGT